MNLNNVLNQFLGSSSSAEQEGQAQQPANNFSNLADKIPGGLFGGAAAGGIMALLMSNKSVRKYAGTAAMYGGTAVLGGLAYKAYQNWQTGNNTNMQQEMHTQATASNEANFHQQAMGHTQSSQNDFELTIVKAMIAASKADGHIDAEEQQRIFQAVEKMDLSSQEKGVVFDSLQKDIPIEELTRGISGMELKAEIYLASCLAIAPDQPAEREHLDKLGSALGLPNDLLQHLERQAYAEAA